MKIDKFRPNIQRMPTVDDYYMGGTPPPIIAGADAEIYQTVNGVETKIGWATNVTMKENFFQKDIPAIGKGGPIGYKSTYYGCDMTVGSYVLQSGVTDAMKVETRRTVMRGVPYQFKITDHLGVVMYMAKNCFIDTNDINFRSQEIATSDTSWKVTELVPANVSGVAQ